MTCRCAARLHNDPGTGTGSLSEASPPSDRPGDTLPLIQGIFGASAVRCRVGGGTRPSSTASWRSTDSKRSASCFRARRSMLGSRACAEVELVAPPLDGGAGDACSGGSGPSTGITRSRAAAPDTSPREQRENAAACEQTAAAARRGSSDAGEDRHREGGGLCCHHGTRTVTEIDRRHGFPVQVARPAVLVLVMIVALPYSSEHRGGARAS